MFEFSNSRLFSAVYFCSVDVKSELYHFFLRKYLVTTPLSSTLTMFDFCVFSSSYNCRQIEENTLK